MFAAAASKARSRRNAVQTSGVRRPGNAAVGDDLAIVVNALCDRESRPREARHDERIQVVHRAAGIQELARCPLLPVVNDQPTTRPPSLMA